MFLSFSSQTNTTIIEELGQWSLTATDADNDSLTVTRSLVFDDKHVVQVLLVFDPVTEQLEFVKVRYMYLFGSYVNCVTITCSLCQRHVTGVLVWCLVQE